MSKTMCGDAKEIARKSKGKDAKYICKKCGSKVVKEKWVCKPKRIK